MSLQPSNKLFVHSSPLIQISVLVTRFHILYTVQYVAFFSITLECPKHSKGNWLRGDVPWYVAEVFYISLLTACGVMIFVTRVGLRVWRCSLVCGQFFD
jgi:hypothetical protein